MPDVHELVAEIRRYCEAHANPSGSAKWRRYFKEGFDAWGILEKDDPLWTVQRDEWSARYDGLGLRGFLSAGAELFRSGKYEEGALAIHFVARRLDGFRRKELAELAEWFRAGIGNWGHTDVLCNEILSPLLVDGKVRLEDLAGWRKSDLPYQRRAVPVALTKVVKTADPAQLLEFIRPMMLDEARVVHQGLGWLLREIWKVHPAPVEKFLLEWKDTAARLIFQYATEKMTASARQRFRAEKKAKAAAADGESRSGTLVGKR